MFRIVLFLIILFVLDLNGQIENNGFEQWDTIPQFGEFGIGNCYRPIGWNSPCSAPFAFFSGLAQSEDSFSGEFALELTPSGYGDFGYTNGPTVISQAIAWQQAPVASVYQLIGRYKYSSQQLSHEAWVVVSMFNSEEGTRVVLQEDTLHLAQVDEYTLLNMDVSPNSSFIPDSLLITFYSDPYLDNFDLVSGTLVLDDVFDGFLTSPNSVEDIEAGLSVFPNPCLDFVEVNLPSSQYDSYFLYNELGMLVDSGQFVEEGKAKIEVEHLPSGFYFLECTNEHSSEVVRVIKQ